MSEHVILDKLDQLLSQLKIANKHLAAISDREITTEDLE